MKIQEAVDYLNFCDKYGQGVDTDDLSDKQIIEVAQKMMDAGDAVAEEWMETHHEGHLVGECFVCRDGL